MKNIKLSEVQLSKLSEIINQRLQAEQVVSSLKSQEQSIIDILLDIHNVKKDTVENVSIQDGELIVKLKE